MFIILSRLQAVFKVFDAVFTRKIKYVKIIPQIVTEGFIMQVDIYDFDHTLFPMDSGSRFFGYCMLHYPWILVFAPFQIITALLLVTKIISFTTFKKYFFCFVMLVPLNKAVNKFWDKHEKEVFPWFKERKRYAVVISASPDFLLCEIQRRLKFETLICTKHNPKTGAIIGLNCRDEEKVRRFRELFPDAEVTDVYSDSLRHDRPIFSLGKRCFHIVRGERREFNYESVYGSKK